MTADTADGAATSDNSKSDLKDAGTVSAAALARARRVVVKVGSALLVDAEGRAHQDWLAGLAADMADLRARGAQILVVTSGAIALGKARLGLSGKLRLGESQAASAAGQALLIDAWQRALGAHDVVAAQLLLTLDDTESRRRYLNARATLRALLKVGAAPIINENDTVATAEIRYGDNDRLAAHAAQLAGADLLVILSDVDGLYTGDPNADAGAAHIPLVEAITPEIEAMAAGPNAAAGLGSGGMATKLAAARIAGGAGVGAIIAPGRGPRPLQRLAGGGRATFFPARTNAEAARKTWIRNLQNPAGALYIDAGAAKALAGGASLLPAGVREATGAFAKGDIVEVVGPDGARLARGLSAYDAEDLRKIAGRRSDEVDAILGYRRRAAVIDRDDLVMTL